MLRKAIIYFILAVIISIASYASFVYYASYSDGVRSGQLVKFSHKGVMFKTWEGEINQGLSGSQIFAFSVLDKDEKVIQSLKDLEGQYVKISYKERYRTFPWWGDTKYFAIEVRKDKSPFSK